LNKKKEMGSLGGLLHDLDVRRKKKTEMSQLEVHLYMWNKIILLLLLKKKKKKKRERTLF